MKTCLIVDDSEVVRKVARRIFEHLDFEPAEAESGEAALGMCARSMPDAILLDSHIPPMATVEFLTSLRALAGGKDMPVVIYCATDNDPSEIARALTAGAADSAEAFRSRSTARQARRHRPALIGHRRLHRASIAVVRRAPGL